MNRSPDDRRDDATCRLVALVELLDHDLSVEPGLKFSNSGLLGLQRILQDCVSDLHGTFTTTTVPRDVEDKESAR